MKKLCLILCCINGLILGCNTPDLKQVNSLQTQINTIKKAQILLPSGLKITSGNVKAKESELQSELNFLKDYEESISHSPSGILIPSGILLPSGILIPSGIADKKSRLKADLDKIAESNIQLPSGDQVSFEELPQKLLDLENQLSKANAVGQALPGAPVATGVADEAPTPAASAVSESITYSGLVKDFENNTPISEVKIDIQLSTTTRSAMSNVKGAFTLNFQSFELSNIDTLKIQASKNGYETFNGKLPIIQKHGLSFDIQMKKSSN